MAVRMLNLDMNDQISGYWTIVAGEPALVTRTNENTRVVLNLDGIDALLAHLAVAKSMLDREGFEDDLSVAEVEVP